MFEGIARMFGGAGVSEKAKELPDPGTVGSQVLSTAITGTVPPSRGTKELVAAYKTHVWLRGAVSKIAESVAATEWTVSVPLAGDQRERARVVERAKNMQPRERAAFVKQNFEEIESHPLLDILKRGNGMLKGRHVLELTQIYLDVKGEAFLAIERDALNVPFALWPLPPHWIRDIPSADKPWYDVQATTAFKVPAENMLWIKFPDPINPYVRGTGMGEALGTELDTDEYCAEFIKSFFFNHAVPNAIVGFEGASENDVRKAEVDWSNKYQGARKAHRVAFFNRKADVKILANAFKDQEAVKLRRFLRDTVIQTFGIPPEIMGIVENSNRATIQSAESVFAKWVLVPRLERLRLVIQGELVPMFDAALLVGYVSPVPSDRESILEAAKIAPWARTVNEWRELQGLSPRDDGDVFMVPSTMRAVEAPIDAALIATVPATGAASARTVSRVKTLEMDRIDNIIAALDPIRLNNETDALMSEELAEWGNETMATIGSPVSFSIRNPRVVEHLAQYSSDRVVGINQTTVNQLRAGLTDGVLAGEGVNDLRKRVDSIMGEETSRVRSIRIARTEVVRSSNFGDLDAWRQSGLVGRKKWLNSGLANIRDAHVALQGQTRNIDSPFDWQGNTAQHPGGFGVASLDIQCRCTMRPIITVRDGAEDVTKQVSDDEWVIQQDRRRRSWEADLADAFERGFALQYDDVIAALEANAR